MPDFTHTDEYQVALTLDGEIRDDGFMQFLRRLGEQDIDATSTQDLLVFDCVRHGRRVPADLRPWLRKLLKQGVLVSQGRGRGTAHFFAPRLFDSSGHAGVIRRKPNLAREEIKAAIFQVVAANAERGTRFDELRSALPPALSRDQIQTLLRELKEQGAIRVEGATRASMWYPTNKTQSHANDSSKSA